MQLLISVQQLTWLVNKHRQSAIKILLATVQKDFNSTYFLVYSSISIMKWELRGQ